MRKVSITSAIVVMIAVLMALSCLAAVGDKTGNIYATDIKTYVNGVQVKAYNIGGRTCIPIEDVTSGYAYNNDFRTLLVHSFDPDILKEYTGTDVTGKVGDIVGSVYETDIKTYFYDKELTSYNIGGKTCVAIEDIGDDNTFSSIGGRYIWNPANRTICLDYLYDVGDGLLELQRGNGFDLKITNGVVEFVPVASSNNYSITYDTSEMVGQDGKRPERPIPLRCISDGKETVVGYNQGGESYFFYWDDSGKCSMVKQAYVFNFFYKDKIAEAMNQAKSTVEWRVGSKYTENSMTATFTVGSDTGSWSGYLSADKTDVTMDMIWIVETAPAAEITLAFYPALFPEPARIHSKIFYALSALSVPSVTEMAEISNTPEVRTAVHGVMNVMINGATASGDLFRTQGNGHCDYVFRFDGEYNLKPGDEVTVVLHCN